MMVYVEESTSYKVYKVGLQNCDDKFFYFYSPPLSITDLGSGT